MDDDPYDVAAISRSSQTSVLNNGTIVPWEQMLDRYCDETECPEEAAFAVHALPDGSWVTLELAFWDAVTIH